MTKSAESPNTSYLFFNTPLCTCHDADCQVTRKYNDNDDRLTICHWQRFSPDTNKNKTQITALIARRRYYRTVIHTHRIPLGTLPLYSPRVFITRRYLLRLAFCTMPRRRIPISLRLTRKNEQFFFYIKRQRLSYVSTLSTRRDLKKIKIKVVVNANLIYLYCVWHNYIRRRRYFTWDSV